MLIFWIALVIIILLLVFSATVLTYKAKEVQRRKNMLKESFWHRRHKIPLLIETVLRYDGKVPQKDELVDLRQKVSSEAYSFLEQVELEKKISLLINEILRINENDPQLKSDGMFLGIKKELEESLKNIRMRVNDYNFSLQAWQKAVKLPWFIIFAFSFKIDKNSLVWDI